MFVLFIQGATVASVTSLDYFVGVMLYNKSLTFIHEGKTVEEKRNVGYQIQDSFTHCFSDGFASLLLFQRGCLVFLYVVLALEKKKKFCSSPCHIVLFEVELIISDFFFY